MDVDGSYGRRWNLLGLENISQHGFYQVAFTIYLDYTDLLWYPTD